MKLILVLTPYTLALSYDIWLHRTSRVVTSKEKVTHVLAIVFLSVFFISSLIGYTISALVALALALPVMVYDELAFHKDLPKHEKMVHVIGFFCFVGFASYWWYQH
jgi:Sec-independent protein secretion pathway component TatC